MIHRRRTHKAVRDALLRAHYDLEASLATTRKPRAKKPKAEQTNGNDAALSEFSTEVHVLTELEAKRRGIKKGVATVSESAIVAAQ